MNRDLNYFVQKKKVYESLTVVGYVLLGICFIMWIPQGASNPSSIPFLFIGFLGGGAIATIASRNFKKLSNEFKNIYLRKEINKIYPDCHYEVKEGFNKEEIYGSKVLKKQDRYHSEDLIEGEFEGVKFKSADVRLQDVRSNGKSTTVVTVFLGRVYRFRFNKRFKSNILVNQPSFFSNLFGWNKINLESAQFNSELSVFSDNQHEAFYILTPHFMERLLELDRKYMDKITFSFIHNQLYIAINTNIDTFDLKMFHPLDLSILEDYRRQLQDIKDFVHDLNLDNTLFINE